MRGKAALQLVEEAVLLCRHFYHHIVAIIIIITTVTMTVTVAINTAIDVVGSNISIHRLTLKCGVEAVSIVALRGTDPAEALGPLEWGRVVLLARRVPMSRCPASSVDPVLRSGLSIWPDQAVSGPAPVTTFAVMHWRHF